VTCASSNGLPSLVNPDRTMVAPRLAFAYRPKAKIKMFSDWVIRGGYGVNYNTGQYAVFARNLSHQEPFSVTQTNDFPLYSTKSTTAPTPTGCTTTQSAYTYTNSQGQTVTQQSQQRLQLLHTAHTDQQLGGRPPLSPGNVAGLQLQPAKNTASANGLQHRLQRLEGQRS